MAAVSFAALLGLLSVGPAGAGEGAPSGERVWLEHCATCHGSGGAGDGPSARHLSAPPPDLRAGLYSLRSTPWELPPADADLARTVHQGIPGSPMPAFQGQLSPAATQAVVEHLRTLTDRWPAASPPPSPPAPEPPADLSARTDQGRVLFASTCAACHGEEGRGDGPAARVLVDGWGRPIRPRNLRREAMRGGEGPEDLFRTISLGLEGRAMPPFQHLAEEERWALVAYVESLRPRRVAYAVGVDPRPLGGAR